MNVRGLRLGLMTVLGFARRGFFIPYRYAHQLQRAGHHAPYTAVADAFAGQQSRFRETLEFIDSYRGDLIAIGSDPPPAPRWNQDWFPRLDAAVLYAFVRHHRPARIIEVGSGHSTRFAARAIADGEIDCSVTAIDPAPRAPILGLDVEFLESTVQKAGATPFQELEAGDFLVIDSSHILMPGSDVDAILNRVLPALPSGVWVHFHDIFLPDDYPGDWDWRNYNEQIAVAQLVFGGYDVEFSSHYVVTAMATEFGASVVSRLPFVTGAHESSLWLRKRM
tara:strand:+ start:13921 stop:14757 length:837 start_codon:yes stop_codon:yes gene_type:complete